MTIRPTIPRSHRGVDLRKLSYPVIWSPIEPGVRVLCTPDRGPISTNQKRLTNRAIAFQLSRMTLYGLEGEIVAGNLDETRRLVADPSGACLIAAGAKLIVRDDFSRPCEPFFARLASATDRVAQLRATHPFLDIATCFQAGGDLELANYEMLMVERGHPGLYVRSPDAAYRQGYSNAKDGALLSLRRFQRMPGVIKGVHERHGARAVALKVASEGFQAFSVRLGVGRLAECDAGELVGRQVEIAYLPGDPLQPVKPILLSLMESK